ncbi:MAG: PPC domain-containing protein [Verrucomicrobia bacterium]|nr:PPC domain-containing protein [Verrucomicrobiota bacterium]
MTFKPNLLRWISCSRPGGKQGSSFTLTAGGKLDPWPPGVWIDGDGLSFKTNEAKGKFTVEIAADAPLGPHLVRFHNEDGASAPRCFVVGQLEEQLEKEPNDNPEKAQVVEKLPITVNGRFSKADDSDSFAVKLGPGQWLAAWIEGYVLDSPIDPILHLLDNQGTKVAFNHDGRRLDPQLSYKSEQGGTYILQAAAFAYPPKAEVRFTGGESAVYRLTVSSGPVARYAYPAAVQRGKKTPLHIFGWNLGKTGEAISHEFDASGLHRQASQVVVASPAAENYLCLPISDLAESLENEPNSPSDLAQPVSIPIAVNGRIHPAGDEDRFSFQAKKGDRFLFRVDSEKLGFPLDAVLKIEDPAGKELSRGDDTGRSPDPELNWTAPSDGRYVIAIGDLLQRGGSDYVYRIEMTQPRLDFKATVESHAFRVEAGKTSEIKVNVSRLNGFNDTLLVVASDLPEGISCTTGNVSAKGGEITVKLSATEDAKPASQPFRVLAIAPATENPQVRVATANLKGQNAAAGDLLINQTDKIWLTVIPKRPDAKEKAKTEAKTE